MFLGGDGCLGDKLDKTVAALEYIFIAKYDSIRPDERKKKKRSDGFVFRFPECSCFYFSLLFLSSILERRGQFSLVNFHKFAKT